MMIRQEEYREESSNRKQWDVKNAFVKVDTSTTWGIKKELVPAVYELLKRGKVEIVKPESNVINYQHLKALVEILKDRFEVSNLNLAIENAYKEVSSKWVFKDKWVLVVGSGNPPLTRAEVLASKAVAKMLAQQGYGLITGGWPGVDAIVLEAYKEELEKNSISRKDVLISIIVKGQGEDRDFGKTIFVLSDDEWYKLACQTAAAVIMIGGKGGTFQTYSHARNYALPIIPLPSTNGDAKQAFDDLLIDRFGPIKTDLLKELDLNINTEEEANEIANNVSTILSEVTKYWFAMTKVLNGRRVSYNDPAESFGPWLTTKQTHTLLLPAVFKIGKYLVTNQFYLEFIKDGGYAEEAFWRGVPTRIKKGFLCKDQRSQGPAQWDSMLKFPSKEDHHPVSGISYYEATAFCHWLELKYPLEYGLIWCLPTEDMWEYVARSEEGRFYPWGFDFKEGLCNSIENKLNRTTNVFTYPNGSSKEGCLDMAGNVWEYVETYDKDQLTCVLRGGSFKNNYTEIRSHLRLFSVPKEHRPLDFGFRVAQKLTNSEHQFFE